MTHSQAFAYAGKIVLWLRDETSDIATVGSIRRGRPICNDVDIVCIPKIDQIKDMFQTVISERNRVTNFLVSYAGKHNASIQTNGPKQIVIQLPKCQLDLWYADEKNLASRMLMRTGSKDHNVWLATRAKRMNMKWNPYEGILSGGSFWPGESVRANEYVGGKLEQFNSEAEIYARLGLPFIAPENRELDYLIKNFGQ